MYVIIYANPNEPLIVGRSINPLIVITVAGKTAAKLVITQWFPFCTIHPIYPDAPDFESKNDPFE